MSLSVAPVDLKVFLDADDPGAISIWIISIAIVTATVVFLMESMNVERPLCHFASWASRHGWPALHLETQTIQVPSRSRSP